MSAATKGRRPPPGLRLALRHAAWCATLAELPRPFPPLPRRDAECVWNFANAAVYNVTGWQVAGTGPAANCSAFTIQLVEPDCSGNVAVSKKDSNGIWMTPDLQCIPYAAKSALLNGAALATDLPPPPPSPSPPPPPSPSPQLQPSDGAALNASGLQARAAAGLDGPWPITWAIYNPSTSDIIYRSILFGFRTANVPLPFTVELGCGGVTDVSFSIRIANLILAGTPGNYGFNLPARWTLPAQTPDCRITLSGGDAFGGHVTLKALQQTTVATPL